MLEGMNTHAAVRTGTALAGIAGALVIRRLLGYD